MVMSFIRNIFGRSERDEYQLTQEELDSIHNMVQRRLEEERMEKITRVMTTEATRKDDTNFWTVTVDYEETRTDPKGKSDKASVGAKSISGNLDSAIADAWYTIATILHQQVVIYFNSKQ